MREALDINSSATELAARILVENLNPKEAGILIGEYAVEKVQKAQEVKQPHELPTDELYKEFEVVSSRLSSISRELNSRKNSD